ncbi:hypothetical protein [Allokutzneria sp. NRRL B-24872]|uniref:hypothetical protein n=1 Tax=Allokutzneria sp. NRRL B-24872 TaxID=1137961 RepID=UPI000A3CEC11|nr:hypothetical protein [Allokutzneria sp. NRRL B-24872]
MADDRHFSGSDNYAGMSLEQLRDLLGSVPDGAAAHLARDFQQRGKVAVQLADRMNALANRLSGSWQAPSVDKAKKAGDGLRGFGDVQQQAAQQISNALEPAATKANSVSETVKTLKVSGREFPKNAGKFGPQDLVLVNTDHARYEQQKEAKRQEAIELGTQLDKQAAAMDSSTPPFPTVPANFFDAGGGETPPRGPGGGGGGGWPGVRGGSESRTLDTSSVPSPQPTPTPAPHPVPDPHRRDELDLAGSDTRPPTPSPDPEGRVGGVGAGSGGFSSGGTGSGGVGPGAGGLGFSGAGFSGFGGASIGPSPSVHEPSPRNAPSPSSGFRPGASPPAPGPAAPRPGGGGSFLQPALGGTGQRAEDEEHQRRYPVTDDLVGDLPLVAPPVIGEYSDEDR